LKKANAVVFAVLHREFIDGGWDYILELLDKNEGVVFDVKSVLPRDKQPDKVTLQRL
ncbi:MAG: nucleotide sugar dehydrogenase, partial [Gammaproteobacteria bacterium]|nr:nucleotide sugar dehydrogenase [Gammaproteobacteria bacterium]NIT12762.1 nucleotide sugar dehydrogenase [Candidatus Dadabacteria bacterium]NIT40871.1 nucleotide sugar dehydrogenase [Gammaproteobacteria bacterium]